MWGVSCGPLELILMEAKYEQALEGQDGGRKHKVERSPVMKQGLAEHLAGQVCLRGRRSPAGQV